MSSRRGADRAALRKRASNGSATTKRAAVLSSEELASLMSYAKSERERALIALMTAGAMRIGEATLLCWEDISEDGLVTVIGGTTKTRTSRSFTLPEKAQQLLLEWRAICPKSSTGWIFPGVPKANPMSVRQGQRLITAMAEAAGLHGVSSHSFRRSTLTAAHQSGLSLRSTAAISGHQSLAALEKYLDADAAKAEAESARGILFA